MSECIAATTSSSERVCGIDTNTCSSCGQRCERDSAASSVESSVPNVIEMATTATEAAFARQFSAHDVAGRQSARPRLQQRDGGVGSCTTPACNTSTEESTEELTRYVVP